MSMSINQSGILITRRRQIDQSSVLLRSTCYHTVVEMRFHVERSVEHRPIAIDDYCVFIQYADAAEERVSRRKAE